MHTPHQAERLEFRTRCLSPFSLHILIPTISLTPPPSLITHPDDRLRRLRVLLLRLLAALALILLHGGLRPRMPRLRLVRRIRGAVVREPGLGRARVDVVFAVRGLLVGDVGFFCGRGAC